MRRLVLILVFLILALVVAPVRRAAAGLRAFCWPVVGTITTPFSASHLAIDIAAPQGTAVYAADAGTVVWAGWKDNGGGLVVDIDHGYGWLTSYNHLSQVFVNPGQWAAAGQVIGAVGMTGDATGPHVHFAVSAGGTWIDPLAVLACSAGAAPIITAYTLQVGDTLDSVAARFGTTAYLLRAWNYATYPILLTRTDQLTAGWTLAVVGDANAVLPTPPPSPSPTPTPSPTPVPDGHKALEPLPTVPTHPLMPRRGFLE